MQPTTELPQTFWAKVEKTDTHWLWTGAHQPRGYGSFAIAGKTYQAHRLAFDIGDPLIELQSIKRVLQTKADSALSPGESA